MLGFRRYYYDTPNLKPLLRGLFLVPSYLATIYYQLVWPSTTLSGSLIYWTMHIQLLVSLLFHILEFGKFDRLSCYLDRLAVAAVNASSLVAISVGIESHIIGITACITPLVFIIDPEANIRASAFQVGVGFAAALLDWYLHPVNGPWWLMQLIMSVIAGYVYVLEIYCKFPYPNKWVGWHDVFHTLINIPYIIRLTSMPGIRV